MKTWILGVSLGLLSFIFSSCTKPLLTEHSSDAKIDANKLLNSFMPLAEKSLQDHREFYPFGGKMAPDGKISLSGASSGEEKPKSGDLISLLREGFKSEASSGKIRACAIFYDVRATRPGKAEKQDAIAIDVEQVSGYSMKVFYPYTFDAQGKLQVQEPFAIKGDQEIFKSRAKS